MSKQPKKIKAKRHRCYSCRKIFPKGKIKFRTNPYWVEINDDYTKGWLCDKCVEKYAGDI